MAAKMDFGVDDLTKSALKRLVAQLLAASADEEKAILAKLADQKASDKERDDLANLVEEKRGKPAAIPSDEDEVKPTKRMA